MHTLDDTLADLEEHAPDALRASVRAFADPPDDFWARQPLGDLPGYVNDAIDPGLPEPFIDRFRHAHQLGLLFGWLSERPERPGQDPRLRGYVLGRWKATLGNAALLDPSSIVDRVVHVMRWMRWGLSAEATAHSMGKWTLPEMHKSLRWRAAARGLASMLLVRRHARERSKVFERTFEQLVLGLAQVSVDERSALPHLLGCGVEELHRSGEVALGVAQIDAREAGLTRIAELCRELGKGGEAPIQSGAAPKRRRRRQRSTEPDLPRSRQGSS